MAYIIIGPRGEGAANGRLVIVNTTTNESVVVDGLKQRSIDPRPPLKHTNGNVFFQGNPLREVNLGAGTITNRGSMVSRDNYVLREGPNGLIWMGGAPQLRLAFYNPSDSTITDCGNPWVGYGQEFAEGYVYTMEVDPSGDYVYCGLGKQYWRLAVWDVVNTTWLYPFGGDGDTVAGSLPEGAIDNGTSNVVRNAAGTCFYKKQDTNQWYSLNGSETTPVSAPTTQSEQVTNGVLMTVSSFGLETNWSELFPGSDGVSKVRYRPIGSEDPYTEVSATVPVYNVPLRRVYPLSTGQVLLVPEAYYPLALLSPDSNTISTLAPTGSSNYGVMEVNQKIYLSGYANSFHQYDFSQPWTLNKVAQGSGNSSTNPASYSGFAKYNRLMDTLDGKIYFGSQWERDDTGSQVGKFDPITKSKSSLRTGLVDWNVRGFCVGGGKLVHSIIHRLGSQDARLWFIDPETMTKESEVTPISGLKTGAHLVSLGNGDVIGCVSDKAYRVRVSDGEVLWTATMPGAFGTLRPSYDVNLAKGTDDNIYLWIGARLWRLNPENGETTKTGLSTTSQGWLTFAENGDLWISGGTAPRRVKAERLYE